MVPITESQPRRTAQTVALTCCWHGQGSRLWLQISRRTRTQSFMIFHDLSWFISLVIWQTQCHKATIWATLGDGLNPTHRNGDTVLGMVYSWVYHITNAINLPFGDGLFLPPIKHVVMTWGRFMALGGPMWTHIIPTIHSSSLIVSYTPIISHDVPILTILFPVINHYTTIIIHY